MLIKTKKPQPLKPEPIRAQSNNKVVQPIRCATNGELMVHQTNQPVPVGNGVNRYNKDGVLILGDDGRYLRNHRVEPDGTTVVKVRDSVDVNLPPVIEVKGTVDIGNTLTVEPVVVLNIPKEIKIQKSLNVVQTPHEAKVAPISFDGFEQMVLSGPCKIYAMSLTVYDATWLTIPGITGEMYVDNFKMSLFPLFVQLDELIIKVKEQTKVGGYVLYEA